MKTLRLALAALLIAASALAADSAPPVKIAILKLIPRVNAKADNFAKLEKYAREAAAAGVKILVSSECYLDGYPGNIKLNPGLTLEQMRGMSEPLDGPYVRRACALAQELGVMLVFGFSEWRAGHVYNTAAFIAADGRILGTYSKAHTRGEIYAPGSEFPVFDTPHGRVGLLICYDRQLPENSRLLAIRGAEMILIPAHSPSVQLVNEDLMMQVRAYENNAFVVLANPYNALAADPDGRLVARNADRDAEGVVYATFDPRVRAERSRTPLNERRPEIYGELARPK